MPTNEQHNRYDELLERAHKQGLDFEVLGTALDYLFAKFPQEVIQDLQDACYDWDL